MEKMPVMEGLEWRHFILSICNVINAIVGSGILGLAYAMRRLGIVPFLAMILLVAGLAYYGVCLLLDLCCLTGVKSYERIAKRAYGRPGKFVCIVSIVLSTVGMMCSYLFVLKYELPSVIKMLAGLDSCQNFLYTNGDFLVILALITVILPLASLRNISFLGYTSGFAMCCMIFCAFIIISQHFQIPCPLELSMPDSYWHFMLEDTSECHFWNEGEYTEEKYLMEKYSNQSQGNPVGLDKNASACHLAPSVEEFYREVPEQSCGVDFVSLSLHSAFAVPTMMFAFQCHACVLPIYNDSKQSKNVMKIAAFIAVCVVLFMYVTVSLFGYLTFKNATGPELFVMYAGFDPTSTLNLVARICVIFVAMFSTPIMHYPCRQAFIIGLFGRERLPGANNFRWLVWLGSTLAILTFVLILVLFVPNISDVFGFTGATASTMLVMIMPAGFYYKLGPEKSNSAKKRLNLFIVIFGFIFVTISVGLLIYSHITDSHEHVRAPCHLLEGSLNSEGLEGSEARGR